MSFKRVLADYVTISKPRIILLLVIVAWAAMFVAAKGVPNWQPLLAVSLAGILSTASAGAFNNVVEHRRDSLMARTASRPVASGRISIPAASIYATAMGAASFLVLFLQGYQLASYLTLGAIAYYVVVYTILLKPNTVQNTVIGGFAGSIPALIGWSAITGSLAWPAWILALLVFVWSPAHFWALALFLKEDYAAADYPMMPIVKGDKATLVQIIIYAAATVIVSLSMIAFGGGWIYLVAAIALGIWLMVRAFSLQKNPEGKRARAFFFFTIQYLGVLLIALMIDAVFLFPVF